MATRREFLQHSLALGLFTALAPNLAAANTATAGRLLILIELKGGNDGLNTVIPYADSRYYAARPKIAIARDQVLQLDERTGLHPALAPLLPLWQTKRLGIVQGLGYPKPNLSHFRSIEIWDTASASDEYLPSGWLTRALQAAPLPAGSMADGLVLGSNDLGPLAGGARAVVIGNAPLTASGVVKPQAAPDRLSHLLKVQQDLNAAAAGLNVPAPKLATVFPNHEFGRTVQNTITALAKNGRIGVLRLTLAGFDTHINQPGTQARLLKELADGILALQTGLEELGRWNDTLLMTYAEFGRRVAENKSTGTDHGTANVHFVSGGAVRGGLYGKAPDLGNLDAGNLRFGVDFHSLYATAAQWCWGDAARQAVGNAPLLGFV